MRPRVTASISLIMLLVCILFFYFFYNEQKNRTIEELNTRQFIHAKQASKSLEDFINSWINTLATLAKDQNVIENNLLGKEYLKTVHDLRKDEIKSMVRLDSKGTIINSAESSPIIGKNISNQKHVAEIIKNHKVVLSDVFDAVQGYKAIAIHAPIFKNGKFDGTIGSILQVESFAKKYLEDIKIGKTGYAWMISKEGVELYCPVSGHIGKSVFENSKGFPTIIAMAKRMIAGNQGSAVYFFNKVKNKDSEHIKKYAVFMPVKVYNTYWSIVVASTEEEALSSLTSFRNKLIAIIIIMFLTGFVFSYYSTKAWGILKESEARKIAEVQLLQFNAELEKRVNERTIQLEELNRDLASFNYTISHDLRTPLRAIVGLNEILKEDHSHKLNPEALSVMEKIERATSKMDSLIESILKLSRVNSHRLDIIEVNLTKLAQSIARELEESASNKNIKFIIQENLFAKCDKGLIVSVIQNLFSNAVKYSSKVNLPVVEFFALQQNGEKVFCVKDNGAGFNSAQSEGLFSLFKRFHDQSEFEGIGIGLATVKKIIGRHNGKIWAESKVEEGACFYFTLPEAVG